MLVRVLLTAIFVGVLAGVFATAIQSYRVIPLILEAEQYEGGGGDEHSPSPSATSNTVNAPENPAKQAGHSHDQANAGHDHNGEAWAPADGWERVFYTTVSNIVVGVAFSLILTCGILLTNTGTTLKSGLAWGGCGFVVFVLAPNFGLPPELPGMQAAGVYERQMWWLGTVVFTAGGLALLAFKQGLPWMLLGVALIVVPHIYGAPQPVHHETAVPANLAAEFVMATIVASALFWLFLGGLLGFMQNRAIGKDQ